MDGLGMSRDVRVVDAAAAESTAKRYLESQKKVVEARISEETRTMTAVIAALVNVKTMSC